MNIFRFDTRPDADSPILDDDAAFLVWNEAGRNALPALQQIDKTHISQTEQDLALGVLLRDRMRAGGMTAWLREGRNTPEYLTNTVSMLHRIGATGMAHHIERSLALCLTPPLAVGERLDELTTILENAGGDTVAVSLEALGKNNRELSAFLRRCEREIAESGQSEAYREWYLALAAMRRGGWLRRLLAWLTGKQRPLPIPAYLDVELLPAGTGEMRLPSLHIPFHIGDVGYFYWEPQFLSCGYRFALERIFEIRPSYLPE